MHLDHGPAPRLILVPRPGGSGRPTARLPGVVDRAIRHFALSDVEHWLDLAAQGLS
ncbi:hypothetical protein ACH4KN_26930 [Streptomyces sp. NPDC017546]|uniref:hypothetical protein n=1 Tax=unclassified Streptomyces TaxID=2593676 RepID=UPI0023619219|nr:hypothetical protein [Streptomyces sp. MMBL 11-1]